MGGNGPSFLADQRNVDRFYGTDNAGKKPTSTVPDPQWRDEAIYNVHAGLHLLLRLWGSLARPLSISRGEMCVFRRPVFARYFFPKKVLTRSIAVTIQARCSRRREGFRPWLTDKDNSRLGRASWRLALRSNTGETTPSKSGMKCQRILSFPPFVRSV